MASQVELWSRIHAWLAASAPRILASLNPPASEEQLRAAEQAFGVPLPEDWRDLYRVHNGMHSRDNLGSLFHCMHFMSLEEAIREHGASNTAGHDPLPVQVSDPGINVRDMHNPRWVAFAGSGDTLLRIDMDPANGSTGQVIFTDYALDTVILVSGGIRELLTRFAADLEGGRYFLNAQAKQDGDQFLDCVPEIDIVNWSFSPRWRHLMG